MHRKQPPFLSALRAELQKSGQNIELLRPKKMTKDDQPFFYWEMRDWKTPIMKFTKVTWLTECETGQPFQPLAMHFNALGTCCKLKQCRSKKCFSWNGHTAVLKKLFNTNNQREAKRQINNVKAKRRQLETINLTNSTSNPDFYWCGVSFLIKGM